MNECQGSSLAARCPPAPGAVFTRPARAFALGAVLVAMLAACGQKGPLFLPAQAGTSAHAAAHPPSAPDDRARVSPIPPEPAADPPPAPSGVVPPTH